jgi:predicted nucleotidyltransferase
MSTPEILAEIKRRVLAIEPQAEVILYGSYARGTQGPASDIDLLILLEAEQLTYEAKRKVMSPLFDIELQQGIIVSPMVLTRTSWVGQHQDTLLYREIEKDGRIL